MKFETVNPKSKIDKIGKIYIPKKIRDEVNIDYGKNLEILVNEEKDAILLKLKEEKVK